MFDQRSHKKELLDEDHIPEPDLVLNLKELHTINKLLGGYAVSIRALKHFLKNDNIVLVDIGSGGGDTLKHIHRHSKKFNSAIKLYGIDLKAVCVKHALHHPPQISEIIFIQDDYRNIHKHVAKVDVIHCALFCHHLSELQIIELINFVVKNQIVLVINDLERNPIAYYAIKMLTKLFSKSYLVKNDAPLSVLRGFKKTEWRDMIHKSLAKRYTIKNRWAFRHEIIIYG